MNQAALTDDEKAETQSYLTDLANSLDLKWPTRAKRIRALIARIDEDRAPVATPRRDA